MPLFKNPSKFGNLFILFKVKFPQNLTSDQKLLVKETLMKVEGMN
jgi:DnaJ-class molecular chaperone